MPTIKVKPHELSPRGAEFEAAAGTEPSSRLSCQAIVVQHDLTVEIPRYSINHAAETTKNPEPEMHS